MTASCAPSSLSRAAVVAVVTFACTPVGAGNETVQRDFAEHRSNVEVTVEGTVTRMLTDDTGPSGTHQRFIIQVAGATQTLLIENNIDIGKRVPLAVGDRLTVRGEYVWNAEGGLVHFTHHDPQRTHEDGWIELRGVRYAILPILFGRRGEPPGREGARVHAHDEDMGSAVASLDRALRS